MWETDGDRVRETEALAACSKERGCCGLVSSFSRKDEVNKQELARQKRGLLFLAAWQINIDMI